MGTYPTVGVSIKTNSHIELYEKEIGGWVENINTSTGKSIGLSIRNLAMK